MAVEGAILYGACNNESVSSIELVLKDGRIYSKANFNK